MLTDKTGRNLRKNQVVDVYFAGMLTATVVDIQENRIVAPNTQKQPPVVWINAQIPVFVQGNQVPMYIIGRVDETGNFKPGPSSMEEVVQQEMPKVDPGVEQDAVKVKSNVIDLSGKVPRNRG